MKPRIIVDPRQTNVFAWWSDGWNTINERHSPKAMALMDKAHAAIEAGVDRADVIKKLEEAGFQVDVMAVERD